METEKVDEAVDGIDELIAQGEFEEADEALEGAIERFGEVEELLVLRAELALEAEEYGECVAAAEYALNNGEEYDDEVRGQLLELKGYAQFCLDDSEEARKSFNEAIRVGGGRWEALLGRAMVHEDLFYDRAALLDLDRAIAVDDQEAQPFAIRGNIRLRSGNLEEAEKDLEHAVDIDPDDEESRLSLARVQATARKTSAAMETLEPLVEGGEDPAYVMPAALLRSQLSLTLGSTDAAREDAEVAIEAAADEPWGYLQLAACELTAMRPGDAISASKKAEATVDDVSQIPDIYALRASAYDQLEKADKAKQMRQKAEGTARLPAVVYGEILNPAQNVPINPDKPIDARTLMEQIFEDPSQAPEGYEEALRQAIARIPELIQQNPGAERLRLNLPQIPGSQEAPKSLVIEVNQRTKSGGATG